MAYQLDSKTDTPLAWMETRETKSLDFADLVVVEPPPLAVFLANSAVGILATSLLDIRGIVTAVSARALRVQGKLERGVSVPPISVSPPDAGLRGAVVASEIIALLLHSLLSLLGAFDVFLLLADLANAVADGDELLLEFVGAEFNSVELHGEGDFAHNLGLLLSILAPEEADEVDGHRLGTLLNLLVEGDHNTFAEVVGVTANVAVQLEEDIATLDGLFGGIRLVAGHN
ncbi:ubiquitin carboxyl-terminal hydrolase, partial [Aureobasidium sp. EXF-3399]